MQHRAVPHCDSRAGSFQHGAVVQAVAYGKNLRTVCPQQLHHLFHAGGFGTAAGHHFRKVISPIDVVKLAGQPCLKCSQIALLVVPDDKLVRVPVCIIGQVGNSHMLAFVQIQQILQIWQNSCAAVDEHGIAAFVQNGNIGAANQFHHFAAACRCLLLVEQDFSVIFQFCAAAINVTIEADLAEKRVYVHGSASGVDEGGIALFAGCLNGTDCGFRQIAVL